MPTVYARAFAKAAEICGEQELARRLGLTIAQLRLWTQGLVTPPESLFLLVVDILSEDAMRKLSEPNSGPGTPGEIPPIKPHGGKG